MKTWMRGLLITVVAGGLVACGGDDKKENDGDKKGDNGSESSGSESGSGSSGGSTSSSGYAKSDFYGTWNIDSSTLEAQLEPMIQEALLEVPEEQRAMAEGMMRTRMMQGLGQISMMLNPDGSASVVAPGDNGQPETLSGEWTFEGGTLRIGMPDSDAPDEGLQWVEAVIVDKSTVKVTPPGNDEGMTMELTMRKAGG